MRGGERQFMSYWWRSLKEARFTFSTSLKAGLVGILIPAKLTSPAVSLLVSVAGFARIANGWGNILILFRVISPVSDMLHDHVADVADPGALA
jgi:hypothetical protein